MDIINNENIITNTQLNLILDMLQYTYKPKKIIIHETKDDFLNSRIYYKVMALIIYKWRILNGRIEGMYDKKLDYVYLYVFSQLDDGDNIHSMQLYSLHALIHELRHVHQVKTKSKVGNEGDADRFATNFINGRSKKISKIMDWKDEWKIEEED